MGNKTLIGPFTEIITFKHAADKGPLAKESLEILANGGVLIDENGQLESVDLYENMLVEYADQALEHIEIKHKSVLVPGLVDCHTHLLFGGSRAADFHKKLAGKTYLQIAEEGGGIRNTVEMTTLTPESELLASALERIEYCISNGITTVEVKSGYGLSIDQELKLLRLINKLKELASIEIIPTCLAAHTRPLEYLHDPRAYLDTILEQLNPQILAENLSSRKDIFVEQGAFGEEDTRYYLDQCSQQGFDVAIHGDQFTTGGSKIAVEMHALSVDHLEASGESEIEMLAASDTVGVVLPGASLGLGIPFASARKLLDAGGIVAIASDWNPGSAPMGDLLIQASLLASFEKLHFAEMLAGITFRAARALGKKNIGRIVKGYRADLAAFPVDNYKEILYRQGIIKPSMVWASGKLIRDEQ